MANPAITKPRKAAAQAPGGGKSTAEIVRQSNRWRDNYNPLRGLVISKVVYLFERAERGDFAEIQLVIRKIEKRYPILKALKSRRLAALEKLDWDIKTVENLPQGASQAQAEAQQKFLRSRYEMVCNLRETFGFLALAEFRGFAILQKHRFADGPSDGAVREFHWLPQCNFQRAGQFGDFYYNANSNFGVTAESLGAQNRIGGDDLPREEFVIRECDNDLNTPLYEVALVAFVNWSMGRKDFAAFVEIFGLPNAVVIMPPNIPTGKEEEYQASAEKVADGVSGGLPFGSDVKFPSASVRGESPFKQFCDAHNEDVVFAGTSGLLTMLSMPTGIGSGASKEHADAFDDIAQADALKISEVLQRDFDKHELAAEFPGQPVLAYFELAAPDEEDVDAVVARVVSLEGAGFETDADEVSEKVALKLKRKDVASGVSPDSASAGVSPNSASAGTSATGRTLQLKNRIQAPAQNSEFKTENFFQSVGRDIAPVRETLERIQQITDHALWLQKMREFIADFDALKADILADPQSASALEQHMAVAFQQGLGGASVPASLTNRILNFDPEQPRDDQGQWTGMGNMALRSKVRDTYGVTPEEAYAHIYEQTGKKGWNADYSHEEVLKVKDSAEKKWSTGVKERRTANAEQLRQKRLESEREAAAAETEKESIKHEERKAWLEKAAEHRARGDEDAANHSDWMASADAEKHRGSGFSPREIGHPQNNVSARASELAVNYGSSGQTYFKPIHQLVTKNGVPTADFWNMWRQNDFKGATAKKDLVRAGMIPEKTAEGWKVKFKNRVLNFDPEQPRDDQGQWSDEGGGLMSMKSAKKETMKRGGDKKDFDRSASFGMLQGKTQITKQQFDTLQANHARELRLKDKMAAAKAASDAPPAQKSVAEIHTNEFYHRSGFNELGRTKGSDLAHSDGTPTQKFWEHWNDDSHETGPGMKSNKELFGVQGLYPEKTQQGWKLKWSPRT